MTIARHAPWIARGDLHNEIKTVFDRFFNAEDSDPSSVVTSQWTPRVDVKEEGDRFVIFADVPGVEPADIEVHMDKGILSIKGERSTELKESQSNGKFTRVERSYGSFHRRFALPDSANADGITAAGRNGVLEISIPKKPETTPRRIVIES